MCDEPKPHGCQVFDARPWLISVPSPCPSRKHPWQFHTPAYTSYCLCVSMRHRSRRQPAVACASSRQPQRPMWTTFRFTRCTNTALFFSKLPQCRPISIHLPLPTTPPMAPPSTRSKNKTSHPGAPDMTPSQLASAGLPRPTKPAKLSMAKEIAALKAELRAAQEVIYVCGPTLYFSYLIITLTFSQSRSNEPSSHGDPVQDSLDTSGDTEPTTDVEETSPVGTKRKKTGSARTTSKFVVLIP